MIAIEGRPGAGTESRVCRRPAGREAALVCIKAVHSLIFLGIGACLAYFFVSGVRGRSGRRAALAGAVVAAEAAIYAGNGWRCPLTGVAEGLGAERGSVSDIYLPTWLADHLAEITSPIFAIALALHARNVFGKNGKRHG